MEHFDTQKYSALISSGAEDTEELSREQEAAAAIRSMLSERGSGRAEPFRACVKTFGCQMNARDSEKLSGILSRCGYELTDSEEADLVIYNTCTVRDSAATRVYGRLGRLKHYKKQHPDMIIAVCGCLSQAEGAAEMMNERYPFIDIIFGTHNLFRFAELLRRRLETGERVTEIWGGSGQIVERLPVKREYPFKSGVNIMFGCDNFCSYCIVPYVRGRERSRRPDEIIDEIRALADDGVIEVMLLGQNVNSYGKGLEEQTDFASLLNQAAAVDGIERVRFMTSHPKDLSDSLIEAMAETQKIARHLHLPLQSGSSRVLKAMNRHYTKEGYLELTERIRERVPDIALTTDIIVGFPGETEEDFEETLDTVRRVRYSSAFTFLYSKRRNTPAAVMEDQIPAEVASERFDRLLKLVQTIAAEECAKGVGSSGIALAEGMDPKDPSMVTGRLSNNIMVHFPGDASVIGHMVPVKLTRSHGFYYTGEMR